MLAFACYHYRVRRVWPIQNNEYIDKFLGGVDHIVETISRSDISRAVDALYEVWRDGRTMFTVGNGGSASTASHFASDLNKMTIVPGHHRVRALSLVDNIPLVSALTNDDGWENIFVEQLRNLFQPGDMVDVIGISKGKGFAGGVKRHHFRGGPKTHGQSDRHRAPGSIGAGTTPGRVFKGTPMAGHMGYRRVTATNLKVVQVDPERNLLLVRGAVPGARNGMLVVKESRRGA